MTRAAALVLTVALGALPASAGERGYAVDAAASSVGIHVGRAGVFKFAGHEHAVVAPRFTGEVVANADALGRSSVALAFEARALAVFEKGEPAGDAPKVQARMLGPELLDVARFTSITFRSTAVRGRETRKGLFELSVTGDLGLHGVTKSLTFPVRVEVAGETLTATGQAVLRHTDFGLTPVSVAGVVKVKNEIEVDFRIVARAPAP